MPDTTIIIGQSPSEVDWALIANKALDIGTDAAKTMADKVKEIAPEAWEILIRQVYVDSITTVVTSLFLGVVFFMMWFLGIRLWKNPGTGYDEEVEYAFYLTVIKILPACSVFSTAIVFCVYSINIIKVLINPKYYAIQKLFELAGMK